MLQARRTQPSERRERRGITNTTSKSGAKITNLMRGLLPPAELLGFETVSGGDLNLGLGEIPIRMNIRRIILRYSEIAPGAVRRPAMD